MKELVNKIRRKWLRMRLQPIRVFCFHQVSDVFNPDTMWECDWTQKDQFKANILKLKEQYTFISISEAYEKLQQDTIRCKKYAVLTADDGWESLKNILPWIAEQQIPITLFVNPAYVLGKEIRENNMRELLSDNQLRQLIATYSNITIASHGWNHDMTTRMNIDHFLYNVERSINQLKQYERLLPFFAYPCGRHTCEQDDILRKNGIIPVYCDGQVNYNDTRRIHREPIDGQIL